MLAWQTGVHEVPGSVRSRWGAAGIPDGSSQGSCVEDSVFRNGDPIAFAGTMRKTEFWTHDPLRCQELLPHPSRARHGVLARGTIQAYRRAETATAARGAIGVAPTRARVTGRGATALGASVGKLTNTKSFPDCLTGKLDLRIGRANWAPGAGPRRVRDDLSRWEDYWV
jgi:hypothetical protein